MIEKRHWALQKCNNGITNRDLKQQLFLGNKKKLNKRNANETLRQTIMLEVVKLSAGSSAKIRKIRVRTFWRSRPPPKRKKRLLAAYEPATLEV
jgi:hypothetical protein